MNETLLYGGFQYVMKASGEILTTADDSEMGYFVDVDLELRDTLEKKHVMSLSVLNLQNSTSSFSLA